MDENQRHPSEQAALVLLSILGLVLFIRGLEKALELLLHSLR